MATDLRTSEVKTPEFRQLLGTAEEAAGEYRKNFLQGLKPIDISGFTPGLKPRPPKEAAFSASCALRCALGKKPCPPGSHL
jgi:hypothetical protein